MLRKILLLGLLAVSFLPAAKAQINSVKTYSAREPIIGDLSSTANEQKNKVQRVTQFVDGLGRPIQSVARWASPNGLDVISPVTYDGYGRQVKQLLPYTSDLANGAFRENAITEQKQFFNGYYGGNSGDFAFADQLLEQSALNRVLQQGSPGATWQLGGGHTVDYLYRSNVLEDNVPILEVYADGSIPSNNNLYYTPGSLSVTEVTDENEGSQQGETVTFTDKMGRAILKMVKEDNKGYLKTYYIYDKYYNLRFVLPPAGVAEIEASGLDWSRLNQEEFREKWMFSYQYDGRNRMVAKRVPGAGWMHMIYDHHDRIILTQDANQASGSFIPVQGHLTVDNYIGKSYQIASQGSLTLSPGFHFTATDEQSFHATFEEKEVIQDWVFTKYDELNRPVLTGIYQTNVNKETLRQTIENDAATHEVYNESATLGGYSNVTFPRDIEDNDLLSVSYYDSYGSFTEETPLPNPKAQPVDLVTGRKGLMTGGKTRVLASNQLLDVVTFYDERYRPTKSVSANHIGGKDVLINTYRNVISPLLSKTEMTHTSAFRTGGLKVTETYAYDHMDRLLTTTHQVVDNGVLKSQKTLVNNEYNVLGELSAKKLNELSANSYAQQVDYTYNIRGWLTRINDGLDFSGTNDRFGMVLQYENAGENAQYNGNIGKIYWRNTGGTGSNTEGQNYAYTYDPLSRLKSATYESPGKNNHFDVNNLQYDANGNIQSLTRKKNGANLDVLDYDYHGNQLTRVEDTGDEVGGFKDVNSVAGSLEYLYDANGNMIRDVNKGISNISYNHLNLPEHINLGDGNYVTYTYDAAGIKLRKESKVGTNIEITDYIAGKHYKNGVLEFFQHSEGRVVKSGNDYNFEYNLTDHLGNVRAVINESGAVVQRQGYYPFGLTFNEWTSTSPKNQYGFQGQEYQEELGWHQYKWRNSDPALGRFFNIDPLAESFYYNSTYAFSENKVTAHVELEGLEAVSIKIEGNSIKTNTTSDITNQKFLNIVDPSLPFSNELSPETKIENGVNNIVFGVVGALASGSYVVGTEGAGAGLGGGFAFSFSLGEVAIGGAQLVDGLNEYLGGSTNEKSSEMLQNSSSLPGLIANGVESEHAPLIDAAGQFIPGPLSGGLGIYDGAIRLGRNPSVLNGLSLYDSSNDLIGVSQETIDFIRSLLAEDNNQENNEQ